MRNPRLEVFVFILFLVFAPRTVQADGRVCGDGPVPVKVEVGRAVEIIVESGVGDLVRSGEPATLKVEHTSGHLFLTPLTKDPAALTIIDGRGASHRLVYIFEEPVDARVVVGECGEPQDISSGQIPSMQLMRDLVSGRIPEGSDQKAVGSVVYEDGKVRISSFLLYELPQLSGYVMRVANLTQGPVIVPVERIEFPGLLLVTVKKDILAQGEQTELYMVVRR